MITVINFANISSFTFSNIYIQSRFIFKSGVEQLTTLKHFCFPFPYTTFFVEVAWLPSNTLIQ